MSLRTMKHRAPRDPEQPGVVILRLFHSHISFCLAFFRLAAEPVLALPSLSPWGGALSYLLMGRECHKPV